MFALKKQFHVNNGTTALILLMTLAFSSCGQHQLGSGDREQETWNYWNALNKAAVSGEGIEVFAEKSLNKENVTTADVTLVLRDAASTELARSNAIAQLPVLLVDPDLTAYAIELAQTQTDAANLLNAAANQIEDAAQVINGENIGLGFLSQLLLHHDDKDVFWDSLLDQGAETASQIKQLATIEGQLKAQIVSLETEIEKLNVAELQVRAKLAQKYGREFPTMASYQAAAQPSKQVLLTGEQIISALIGQKIENGWTFDAQKEFVSFKIIGVTKRSNILIDYEVQTHVKGENTGEEHDFRLRLTFGKFYTRWILVQLELLQ